MRSPIAIEFPLRYLRPACLLAVLVLAAPAAAEPAEPRVSAVFTQASLRRALQTVFTGQESLLQVAPEVPDLPVTTTLVEVPRYLAVRHLLRATGASGLTAARWSGTDGAGQAVVGVRVGFTRPVGESVGPNGIRVPNFETLSVETARRVPLGRPTLLGGTDRRTGSDTRGGIPLLPFGSRSQSRTSDGSGVFITIMVLPEPEPAPETRRKR